MLLESNRIPRRDAA